MDGGPSQLGYGGPDDADGGAGYPNLKQDRNGNAIAKVAAAADIGNSGDSDQLTAFRSLMANPTVEGRRNDVYPDSLKIPTVGIGHKVVPSDNLRVGDTISDDRVNQLFAQDGSKALNAAKAQAAQAGIFDPEFIAHLASVNFQLGTNWTSQFGTTWGKIVAGDYAGAADGLNKTLWARQTPVRVRQFQSALLALPPKAPH
jgi:GH24 family phage-related lysozyme (muramidase)